MLYVAPDDRSQPLVLTVFRISFIYTLHRYIRRAWIRAAASCAAQQDAESIWYMRDGHPNYMKFTTIWFCYIPGRRNFLVFWNKKKFFCWARVWAPKGCHFHTLSSIQPHQLVKARFFSRHQAVKVVCNFYHLSIHFYSLSFYNRNPGITTTWSVELFLDNSQLLTIKRVVKLFIKPIKFEN